jgi:signal peptide peptidase SppA
MPDAYKAIVDTAESIIKADVDFDELFEMPEALYQEQGSVAVITISGVILPSATKFEQLMGAVSLKDVRKAIKQAKDSEATSVIVRFNSPGGVVTGLEQTARALKELSDAKPTTAYVEELCASAAYWLAAQCGEILVSESAEVGSIGVYLAFLTMERGLVMQGVTPEVIKAGKYKTLGIAVKDLSDEEREYLQAGVDETYEKFKSAVSVRGLDESTMQGEVYEGVKAVELKLADGIQDDYEELVKALNA